jgi:hypothetical protein
MIFEKIPAKNSNFKFSNFQISVPENPLQKASPNHQMHIHFNKHEIYIVTWTRKLGGNYWVMDQSNRAQQAFLAH